VTDQSGITSQASAHDTGSPISRLRVALVHDYLNQMGGAEKVVEVFHSMFPNAPLYTSVYDAAAMPESFARMDVRTSFMQRLTPKLRWVKPLLPLYPFAFEQFDLRGYDLVLSSTTTFAKGVLTRPETCHVCYCNTPFRFLWMYQEYLEFERMTPSKRVILPVMASMLRPWDFAAAQRVDYFIAGSENAAARIRKFYRRPATVIHSPIDVGQFQTSATHDDYYLTVGRLQSYKRVDLAIRACNLLRRPLWIVGDGPDRARLERLASPTVKFLGRVPSDTLRTVFSRCRALLWPGEEDFGLAPLEAQASGRPVVAFGRGGALETVRDGVTGVLFTPQTVEALAAAIERADGLSDAPDALRAHAMQFDRSVFAMRLCVELERAIADHKRAMTPNTALPL
jgi:glycosyltransferase involved in cell wall biosynthesis